MRDNNSENFVASLDTPLIASSKEVLFLPLGGVGEIGANAYLYGHNGDWILVDLGISFSDPNVPGVDIFLPDITFALAQKERFKGIVITHAHEDHYGAISYWAQELSVPIYATAFALEMLRSKTADANLDHLILKEISPKKPITIGAFTISLTQVAHSIPETCMLNITTAIGNVLHSSDWRFDPQPIIGEAFTAKSLAANSAENPQPLAFFCDSTNALESEENISETTVAHNVHELIAKQPRRVVVTCFASNVGRLHSICQAAEKCGRAILPLGRAVRRVLAVGAEKNYLDFQHLIVDERQAATLPPEKLLLLCSGSQGEHNSALWRLARGEMRAFALQKDDAVIFSSRTIPGNEREVYRLHNRLATQDVTIYPQDCLHASGHATRQELLDCYQILKPRYCIPIHGEARHLQANAQLAQNAQIKTKIVDVGNILRLTEDNLEIIGSAPSGRFAYDGCTLVPEGEYMLKERAKVAQNGLLMITTIMSEEGILIAEPQIITLGLPFVSEQEHSELLEEIRSTIQKAAHSCRHPSAFEEHSAKRLPRTISNILWRQLRKRPIVKFSLVTLPEAAIP